MGVNIEPDELHVVHLGSSMYLLGSILHVLCFKLLPGSPTDNMETVWGQISAYYSQHGVPTQYTSLTLNSFCDAKASHRSYPKLKR